jgi:hypothetical protein
VSNDRFVIGVVGVCGSGKTELVQRLRTRRFQVKHIAQEHSFVSDMWQRFSKPNILVYLIVSYPETLRRKKFDWSEKDYNEQIRRVQHARQHADIVVNTDDFTPDGVCEYVLGQLEKE